MYLNNQKPDPAIAILQGLSKGGNPELAEMSGGLLAQAQQFKAGTQGEHGLGFGAGQENDGESAVNGSVRIEKSSPAEPPVDTIPTPTPLNFLSGPLVSVACSSPPLATLTVISGGQNWKLQVRDSKRVLVIGADSFSCSWRRQTVALTSRETGAAPERGTPLR